MTLLDRLHYEILNQVRVLEYLIVILLLQREKESLGADTEVFREHLGQFLHLHHQVLTTQELLDAREHIDSLVVLESGLKALMDALEPVSISHLSHLT